MIDLAEALLIAVAVVFFVRITGTQHEMGRQVLQYTVAVRQIPERIGIIAVFNIVIEHLAQALPQAPVFVTVRHGRITPEDSLAVYGVFRHQLVADQKPHHQNTAFCLKRVLPVGVNDIHVIRFQMRHLFFDNDVNITFQYVQELHFLMKMLLVQCIIVNNQLKPFFLDHASFSR